MKNDKKFGHNIDIYETLKELGLKDKEASIYLASLKHKEVTSILLQKETGIKRTTINAILKKLHEKGLLITGLENKASIYSPQNPNALLKKNLEDRKNIDLLIENIKIENDPKLEDNLLATTKEKEIEHIYMETISLLEKGDEYSVISDLQKWKMLNKSFAEKYSYARSKKGSTNRLLAVRNKVGLDYKRMKEILNHKIKFIPNKKLNINIIITPKRLVLHELVKGGKVVLIHNPSIIESYKEIFNTMWQQASE